MPQVPIIRSGYEVQSLYLIQKGKIIVYDQPLQEELSELNTGSFFGDYQILFGLISNYNFVVDSEDEATCLTISKEKFL